MARMIRHHWASSFESMSRRDRQGCDYDAFLPDPLAGWDLALPADLLADLTDAEAAIRRLNSAATTHVSLEGLARLLLRAYWRNGLRELDRHAETDLAYIYSAKRALMPTRAAQ